jgi:hypothetical protein
MLYVMLLVTSHTKAVPRDVPAAHFAARPGLTGGSTGGSRAHAPSFAALQGWRDIMANFRQQLFLEFASKGLGTSVEVFKEKYQPKKENRFNVEGITYEIGSPRLRENCIEFEISSKVPQDELTDRNDFDEYFAAIKEVLAVDAKQPEEIDMDNIVQDLGGEETKERDYVRLVYRYQFDEMYTNEDIAAAIERYQQHLEDRELPEVPNVNTTAGRVLLLCVEDFMQQQSAERMERLIEANQEVRQKLAKAR